MAGLIDFDVIIRIFANKQIIFKMDVRHRHKNEKKCFGMRCNNAFNSSRRIRFMNKALIVDEHHRRLKLIAFGLRLRNVIYRIDI